MKKNPELIRSLIKWLICCAGFCILYCIFDTVGILFAAGLSYVIIRYL